MNIDIEKVHEEIREDINKYQRSILAMFPTDDDDIEFCYTIGNHERGLPELLLIGTLSGFGLNPLSDLMIKHGRFLNGQIINVVDIYPKMDPKFRIKLINASNEAHKEYTIQAGEFYQTEDYEVQQVLLSDKEGRFPGDAGCAGPYASLPVLARTEMLQ